ncbi:Sel1 repeat-containing protein [Litorimonas taeanensis]|uniref:Sel1 repeat-containing protein n=1 Tax=Litorimonas taeanensis TaxID=568099 RepID=A0A420WLD4_9PROT|nr:SEL1-like repeat protein [Litorimonas taeanensis]RKQ71838.1 Sel1 repeat-containing protein [Litorimonas taeanensis]
MSQSRKTSSAKTKPASAAESKALPQESPATQAPLTEPRNKAAAKKTTLKKTGPKKSAPSKRPTLTEMQKSLASLETRMKRADTLTRKSVKTLEEVVANLDARTKKESASQKSALSRRVGRLSEEMEQSLATTQAEIKATLASALSHPNPEAVQTALNSATTRLNNSERHQALAIAKINRHLANLAKAVEDRILKDQVAASEALRLVEKRLSERLETIEADTTEAFGMIGDKVASLSEEITKRNSREDDFISDIISARISDATAKSEAEFKNNTQSLEMRINRLEAAGKEAATNLARTKAQIQDQIHAQAEQFANTAASDLPEIHLSDEIAALSQQIDTLQSRLDTMDANFEALQTQSEIMGQDLMQTKQSVETIESRPAPTQPEPVGTVAGTAYAPNNPSNIVNFTPQTPPAPAPQPIPAAPYPHSSAAPMAAGRSLVAATFADEVNEYVLTETIDAPIEAQPQTGPVEFDPAAYQPQAPQALYAPQAPAQPAFLQEPETAYSNPLPHNNGVVTPPPFLSGNEAAHFAPSPYGDVAQTDAPLNYNDVENLPAGDPMLPYADPAYGEERMDEVRIGATPTKRARKAKKEKSGSLLSSELLPALTGRNVRVAAMATGVTLIGLFAAKTILFGNNDPLSKTVTTEQPLQNPTLGGSLTQDLGQTNTHQTIDSSLAENAAPTIGVYAENQAPRISAAEAGSLQEAAAKGDAIAQFQLGLSQLEQNNIEAGVKNIRLASQTLPAAQYRLAKIYEAGEGVEKNTELAKDLTERAARAGNRIAMHDLAIYYAYGNGGVEVDMTTAAGWFEKAAERGVVDSQFNLAILYENGQGVKPNVADAYFWYSIAASQGDQAAKARLQALDASVPPAELEAAKIRVQNFEPVKINQAANGIFKNLPWNKAEKDRQAAAKVAELKQVQTLLSNMGFEVGAPDGIMGSKTRQAITRFEQANGMEVTGQVSPTLIDKLSIAAGA